MKGEGLLTNIQDLMKERKLYLEKAAHDLERRLKNAPQGKLRISRCGNRVYYYCKTSASDRNGSYIKKKDRKLVLRLAQKDYNETALRSIHLELKAISAYQRLCPKQYVENIYFSLAPLRRQLIEPLEETDEMFVKRWSEEEYVHKGFLPDVPELYTDRGERVRSKSEVIIANLLLKEGIPYKYEHPLYLNHLGTVYPDFTLLNTRLRKEIYWEHQGMMDNPEYAEKAVQKIVSYNLDGIWQGEKLIVTSETSSTPLDVRYLKMIIDAFLK